MKLKEGCINTIRKALEKIDGLTQLSIDKETEVISYEGNPPREQVIAILSKLGYPEKGHNSFTKKAKSYVSCAIGRMGLY